MYIFNPSIIEVSSIFFLSHGQSRAQIRTYVHVTFMYSRVHMYVCMYVHLFVAFPRTHSVMSGTIDRQTNRAGLVDWLAGYVPGRNRVCLALRLFFSVCPYINFVDSTSRSTDRPTDRWDILWGWEYLDDHPSWPCIYIAYVHTRF